MVRTTTTISAEAREAIRQTRSRLADDTGPRLSATLSLWASPQWLPRLRTLGHARHVGVSFVWLFGGVYVWLDTIHGEDERPRTRPRPAA